jgi:hypothetical protein
MVSKPGLVYRESIPVEYYHEYVGGHLNFAFGNGILIDVAQVRGGAQGGWDTFEIGGDRG